MNNKNYLILLTETERSMLQESLSKLVADPFFLIKFKQNDKEKQKIKYEKLLTELQSFYGGIRKIISEENLYRLQNALRWYADFVPSTDQDNEILGNAYNKLSYIIENRNRNSYLFDFDPQNYNPNEKKDIAKKDFSQVRYLIARENNGEINYLKEVGQKDNESMEEYKTRVQEEVEKNIQNNKTGNWLMVSTEEAAKYKYSKDLGYFTNN